MWKRYNNPFIFFISFTDAIVSDLVSTLGSDAILIEGNPRNGLAVDLRAITSPESTPILGDRLWQVDSFLSRNPDGSGREGALNTNILDPLQSAWPLRPGIDIDYGQVLVDVNMQDVSCAEARYMCFRLRRNADATVSFNLQGEPDDSVLTSCLDMTQQCQGMSSSFDQFLLM